MTTDFLYFLVPLLVVALGLRAMWSLGYKAGRKDEQQQCRRAYRSQSILHML